MKKYKITIIQKILPHYRIPLYRLLFNKLSNSNIELQLIYGQEYPGSVPRTLPINESWAHSINNQYFSFSWGQLVWQPCSALLGHSNLIIIEQANSLLLNFWLQIRRSLGRGPKLAFWGHGKNMQVKSANSLSERIKKLLINHIDWWFAYTELTADIIVESGVPDQHITILQNAVETTSLKHAMNDITSNASINYRASLGLHDGPIALFCGGMYQNKKLGFLIDACKKIHQRLPDFQLLLIGNGPEQYIAVEAAVQYDWIHYYGPRFGAERAIYFTLADIFLMPGLVGLAILDSFSAGLPLFTTGIPMHSPEMVYLKNTKNGFISKPSVAAYSDSVCNYLLSDRTHKNRIKAACLASAEYYTLDNMASNFVNGIERCIGKTTL
jgi:glycosyltransferase involved in cell wall biosynthesis